MRDAVKIDGAGRGSLGRKLGWGAAALILLLPFVAMQLTREVQWDAADYTLFGVMLLVAGGAIELAVRTSRHAGYRTAFAVAMLAGFLLIWVNLAVGIIGSEENDANLMYAGVLGIAIGGSILARLAPAGMAKAMVATAIAQVAVPGIALFGGAAEPGHPGFLIGATLLFASLWALSAGLFRTAAARG